MTRTHWIVLGAAGCIVAAVVLTRPGLLTAQNQPHVGLTGSRPIIDAARHPSIQAAIDALPAEGGIVRIPPGLFEIKRPLIVRTPDTTLEGSGTATHIKNTNTAGQPAIVLRKPADAPKNERLWRIRVADLRVTGNAKSGHGILADRVNEVFIQGVTVSYHGGDGIQLDHCYEDPRVNDCLVTYNKGTGLNLLGCHDIVVASNQFEENVDGVRCFDGFNLCMTGNCLDDHLGRGVVIENTYGSVVSGNMIEECKLFAVVLDRDCYGNTLSANVIAHNGGGVDLRDAHGCAVSANTFTIMGDHSIRVGPNSGRITITGNNFSNSYIGDGKVKRRENDRKAIGIQLESTRDIAVTGNVFASLRPKAIELKGTASKHVLIAGNLIADSEADRSSLESSVVEGNLVSDGR